MENSPIADPLFRAAVEAIDNGHIVELDNLLVQHPRLIRDRLPLHESGYFANPFLLWFVADNPIRIPKLPSNITEVTSLLIKHVKHQTPDTLQAQLDYTLGLVATGKIPRECGVQTEMMDLLINAGAQPGSALGALTQGNVSAASYLVDRGSQLTLPIAVGLERMDDIRRLSATAGKEERLTALTVASYYGKPHLISLLLTMGTDPNGFPGKDSGFHCHATPLHQAVSSGSLDAVKLLVAAGARLDTKDLLYEGTALDWAQYLRKEHEQYGLIEEYLRGQLS